MYGHSRERKGKKEGASFELGQSLTATMSSEVINFMINSCLDLPFLRSTDQAIRNLEKELNLLSL